MAPTIQTSGVGTPNEKRNASTPVQQRAAERKSELVCRVKYNNTLPDIPFDCKFIAYPFESSRFINYNSTSLERNYKYEVLTEHDLGVTIDLINKDTYAPIYNIQLDPADEKLLEEDILTPQDSNRSRHHAKSVSWLRRTEYISTEQTRFQPQIMDKVEAKVGFSIKKNFKDDTLYMDRDSQIKAIEKTYADSKLPIEKHYSKPNVTPVEVLPIYPDFKYWKYPCAQVIFDSDPAPVGRPIPAQIEEMSQAMIRGVMDESGEQFVAYFLPTSDTLEKRKLDQLNNLEYTDEMEYEYKMAREYNWNVKSKSSKGYEENYFLIVRDDAVYYNELETRVRLSKRRQKVGAAPNNTRLVVTHRPLNAGEFRMQRLRERFLEPPNEEEEEEEEEEDDDEEEEEQTQEGEENKKDSEDANENDENAEGGDKKDSKHSSRSSSRSRSRSRSKSKSPAKRSDSGSSRGSRSRSGSAESRKSRSRSRSKSPARSNKSASKSPASIRSGSASPARSQKSGSRASSRSKSSSPARANRSRSASPASSGGNRSRSGSPVKSNHSKSASASPARSDKSASPSSNRSRSKSRAKSTSRSRSGSPATSARSRSASPVQSGKSRSPSPASVRSRSASPDSAKSRSASPETVKSRSASPENIKSRSASPANSARSGSGSPAQSDRSRSKSRAPSNSGSDKSDSGSGSSSGSDSGSDSD